MPFSNFLSLVSVLPSYKSNAFSTPKKMLPCRLRIWLMVASTAGAKSCICHGELWANYLISKRLFPSATGGDLRGSGETM